MAWDVIYVLNKVTKCKDYFKEMSEIVAHYVFKFNVLELLEKWTSWVKKMPDFDESEEIIQYFGQVSETI